jgi:6-phosphogluconolactonase
MSEGEQAAVGEPEIVILPNPDACAEAAAERIAAQLRDRVLEAGVAQWATTGGSTPAPIYRRLATPPLRDKVDWTGVRLWWGDERFVPRDHPLSNEKIAADSLLEAASFSGESGTGGSGADVFGGRAPGAPIPAVNVHPIPTGEAIGKGQGPEWSATRYAEMLREEGLPVEAGWPIFDLVLLGVGPDGHIMSVFPGSVAFDSSDWAIAVPAPTHVAPHIARITLNPRILDVARRIIVVAHGEAKADVLMQVLGGEREPRRLPAQLARRAGAVWIIDEAAAARLPR